MSQLYWAIRFVCDTVLNNSYNCHQLNFTEVSEFSVD